MNILQALQSRRLLAREALVYLEQPKGQPVWVLPGFQIHREQQAGQVRVSLWRAVSLPDEQNTFDA